MYECTLVWLFFSVSVSFVSISFSRLTFIALFSCVISYGYFISFALAKERADTEEEKKRSVSCAPKSFESTFYGHVLLFVIALVGMQLLHLCK